MQVRFRRALLEGETLPIHPPAILGAYGGNLTLDSIFLRPQDEHDQKLWDVYSAAAVVLLRLEGSMDPRLASYWEGMVFVADYGPPVRLSVSKSVDTDLRT